MLQFWEPSITERNHKITNNWEQVCIWPWIEHRGRSERKNTCIHSSFTELLGKSYKTQEKPCLGEGPEDLEEWKPVLGVRSVFKILTSY